MAKITKKFRKETCQAIIDRYGIGEAFSAEDLATFNEMCGTQWEGAKHMRNAEYPSDPRHVHAMKNGAWEAFSWNKAISPITDWSELCRTMRALAAEQAREYMSETSETECAYEMKGGCNGPLQADHAGMAFDDIVKEFVDSYGFPNWSMARRALAG